MKTPDEVGGKLSGTDLLNCLHVQVIMPESRSRLFSIVPHGGKMGKALQVHGHGAEIKLAGRDCFATFETEIGNVTYVFCDEGVGFKIGPGGSQQKFIWG